MHRPIHEDFESSNLALRQICGAYRIACDRWWEFRGNVRRHRIGSLEVAEVCVAPCAVIRDLGDQHYLGDQYFLVFQAEGSATMRQKGAEAVLAPGDSTIVDSRFPSVFETTRGFRQFSFHLRRDRFLDLLGKRPVPVARTIHSNRGAGRLLSDMLASYVRNAPLLAGVDLDCMTLQLLSAALGLDRQAEEAVELRSRSVDVREISQFIDAHLERADLTPLAVAARFNLSVRQLYRVIAGVGCTPAALIWQRRLEQARRLLARCDSRVPIIEIALSCGFKDGAHFSRAYRKMFGESPRGARGAVTAPGSSASANGRANQPGG